MQAETYTEDAHDTLINLKADLVEHRANVLYDLDNHIDLLDEEIGDLETRILNLPLPAVDAVRIENLCDTIKESWEI